MADAAPHKGIELDTLELPEMEDKPSPPKKGSGTAPVKDPKKIDSKAFVKDILKKILTNDAFLSFSSQVTDVNRILKMKYSSANDIANVIIKDIALTSKLLKLVNSSFYGQFSNKGISTISEAMIILGTEEIKLAATSLKIYELLQNISTKKTLKDMTLRSLQRSIVARLVISDEGIQGVETIQISAMLYDFGEYLVALFAPGVYINIEVLADEKEISKEKASKSIIGISYSELGKYVATSWKLPPGIIGPMKPVSNFTVPKKKLGTPDLQRVICSYSYDLCAIELSEKRDYTGKQIVQISSKYKKCLGIPTKKAIELLTVSWNKIEKHASILKVTPHKKPG